MKIQVAGLSEGVHKYHFQVEPGELELGEQFQASVLVDATLEKTGGQFFLKAAIVTEGVFECDRCITRFVARLPASYQMYYLPEGSTQGPLDPAEVQIVPAHFSVIDLTDDVRQTILLAIPLKLLCSAGCEGLCPTCGANLNTEPCTCSEPVGDPRWEKLRTFQERNSKNQE